MHAFQMMDGQELSFEQQTFEKKDYSGQAVRNGEFTDCLFSYCSFANSDLSGSDFIDCRFEHCDVSMAVLNGTGLKNVVFVHCKLLGLDFSICHNFLFGVRFDNCLLDYTYFFRKKLKKTVFQACSLKEANFTEADLTAAVWTDCDLDRAVFQRTVLDKADFRSAMHFSINPENNSLKKTRFSLTGLTGLLDRYDIIIG